MSDYDKEYKAVFNLYRTMYSEDKATERALAWMSEQKYAWYSPTMHKNLKELVRIGMQYTTFKNGKAEYKKQDFDCHIYLNLNGKKVICTEINNSPTEINSVYDDYVCLGKVIKWLGNSNEPIQNNCVAGSAIKAVKTLKKNSPYVVNLSC